VTAPPLDDPRADAWKAFDTSTGRRLAGWLLYPFLFVLDGVSGGAWQSDDLDIPVFGRKRLVGWGVRLQAHDVGPEWSLGWELISRVELKLKVDFLGTVRIAMKDDTKITARIRGDCNALIDALHLSVGTVSRTGPETQ